MTSFPGDITLQIMISDFIIRTFIKDHQNIRDAQVRSKHGILEGWISIIINFILFIAKLTTGLIVNSIALISDSIHSLSDLFSSIAVIWGFKMSSEPPDREHPFGHGRMEHIATLIIALLLVVTGFEFLKLAFGRIRNPQPVFYHHGAVLVVITTIIIKEWLAIFSKKLHILTGSKTLMGEYFHHQTDVITSFMVLLALFSEKINFRQFDGIVGILVSIFVMYSGWRLLNEVISPLLGESASNKELNQIKSIALSVKDVKGIHDIILHKYGNVKIISLHTELPEDFTFMEAHNIIQEIQEMINEQMDATTTIHLDPVQKMNDDLFKIHSILDEFVKSNPNLESYHDLRMVKIKKNPTLVLDIVPSEGSNSNQINELHKKINSILKFNLPSHKIKIWVHPKFYRTDL